MLMASCSSSKKAMTTQQQVTQPTPVKTADKKRVDNDRMNKLMSEARKWVGTKYKYGGQTREGTDCSGMVMALYNQVFDIKLPRSSREQQKYCKSVDRNSLRKGDLLFFSSSKNSNSVSHVGLYIGNNEMIHASTSRGVIVSNLTDKYYVRTYHSAGRVVNANEKQSGKPSENGRTQKTSSAKPQTPSKTESSKSGKIPTDAPSVRLEDLINTKIDSIYSTIQTNQ